MTSDSWLEVLNPEQRAAVTHEGSPLLILAGAGSGKTRVITTKIAWLIAERNVEPESILAVTFTNKAAREMAERATRMEPRAERSILRTFHSFGAWLLRRNAALAGLDSNFTIYDDDDGVTLLSKALPALTRQQVSACVHKISRAKDYCLSPDSPLLAEIDPDPDFAEVYALYEKRLRETGNLDFGDLILLPVKLLREHPEVSDRIHRRFGVVMVDEYQDSNVAQFELLKAITGPNTYLCVVGDDDQSIYRFRGAEVRNILTFSESFPGTEVIRLERNYRSVAPILGIASDVVSNNEGRLGKTLLAERGDGKKPTLVFLANQDEEAAFCAELILNARKKGCPFEDWAILYRMNAQSLGFETEFLHRKIPYKVVGSLKFYEREEIKDALSFLALVANGRDEVAFRRVVNKPARGLGEVTQDKIVDEARRILFDGSRVSDGALDFDEQTDLISASRRLLDTLPKKAKAGLSEFIHTVETLRLALGDATRAAADEPVEGIASPVDASSGAADTTGTADSAAGVDSAQADSSAPAAAEPDGAAATDGAVQGAGKRARKKSAIGLAAFVDRLVESSGLLAYHQGQDEIAGTQRVANLQELVNAASLYSLDRAGLTEFLEHIELDRSMANEEENPDSVTLITVHNTKGLEFRRVVITGLEAGVFPREDKKGDDLEEERRLMYVGCTRAMDELYLTSCAARRLYGRTAFMEPSRFLFEMEPSSLEILGRAPRTFASFVGSRSQSGAAGGRIVSDGLSERWKVGRKLFHDDYGYGMITASFYAESELIIKVMFESGGEKRFMPKYQAKNLLLVED
ncbi:MAG TPA: ATP-dependent helicase [Treponemataceae bacterium]|nr:ATP-dependent helicase [Treponemataceae bacterium]